MYDGEASARYEGDVTLEIVGPLAQSLDSRIVGGESWWVTQVVVRVHFLLN